MRVHTLWLSILYSITGQREKQKGEGTSAFFGGRGGGADDAKDILLSPTC